MNLKKNEKENWFFTKFRCKDIIAGCITPGYYLDSISCCAKHFPSDSFPSHMGACVTTLDTPAFYQVFLLTSFNAYY